MDKAINMGGSVNNLHDKLSSMRSECNEKDDLVMKHAKVAEEAIAGWEKAEAEGVFLKQELDEALRKRIVAEERIADLDAALKECMQQLRFNREEQEQRINDAVTHIFRKHEREWMLLEEKLGETSKRLAKLDFENSRLCKTLQAKENLIEDLLKCKSQVEANYNKLMARLDYEEKSNLRSADASHKQNSDSMRKIIKLEKECHRLRLLVHKRLPGPAIVAEMKSEVLGREPDEFNREMVGMMVKNFTFHDSPSKRINFLIEKLCSMEEESKMLKESIIKKNNEIHSLRTMGEHAASNLWSFPNGETPTELARSTCLSHDLSLTSLSESGHEDDISCTESWASALITELEHFTHRNPKGTTSSNMLGVPGMNLMDDFVEMEKLATVSMDKSFESCDGPSHESNTCMHPLGIDLCAHPSETCGKKLVPENHSGSGETSQEARLSDISIGTYPSGLQELLKSVLRHSRITQKNPDEILEEARIALAYVCHSDPRKVIDARENSGSSSSTDPRHICDNISWTPPNVPLMVSSSQVSGTNVSPRGTSIPTFKSDVTKSICRVIELIEGIDQPSLMHYISPVLSEDNCDPLGLGYNNSASSTGYMVRVLQWKSSELRAVLQRFVHTCNDLVNGKAALENFPRELSSALEWIFNHCFSIQDVSSMRDTVKKHFDWDESESESEPGNVMGCPQSDAERIQVFNQQFRPPSSAGLNGEDNFSQMEVIHLKLKDENMIQKQKLSNMESVQKDLEGKLQLSTEKIEELLIQLRKAEESVGSSQTKREPKLMVVNQIENPKFLPDDLDSQLKVARNELNVACQNSLSLELELENKINRCQELETTCIELQLQLDSVGEREEPKHRTDHVDEQPKTDWEITAASEKLAECQETILNLGNQLKALASPKETAHLDQVVSIAPATATKSKSANHRCSLLDKMLSEDNANIEEFISPKKKETIYAMVDPLKSLTHPSHVPSIACDLDSPVKSQKKLLCSNETNYKAKAAAEQTVAIVHSKTCGGVSLLRKIILRRKREAGTKFSYHGHIIPDQMYGQSCLSTEGAQIF